MLPNLILYSHTDYKDIWPIFFDQANIYLKDFKKYFFVNKFDSLIPKDYICIYYNDSNPYNLRVSECLNQMDESVVLFLHEDMILYDYPKLDIIKDFVDLILNKKADFIKVIRSGYYNGKTSIHKNLVNANPENLFSVQPTICLKSNLEKIYKNTSGNFEENVSQTCINNNLIKSFMSCYNEEEKRGIVHWDSKIFPYIATAIVKGKWNREYEKEIEEMTRGKLETSKRGYHR